jgi:hypothetical protein
MQELESRVLVLGPNDSGSHGRKQEGKRNRHRSTRYLIPPLRRANLGGSDS